MWAHELKHKATGVTDHTLDSALCWCLKIACGALQVLVQSFMWADKLKDKAARAEAQEAADRFTDAMTTEPDVLLEQVFAARQGAVPPATGLGSCLSTRGHREPDAECLRISSLLGMMNMEAGKSVSFVNVRTTLCGTQ